MQSYKHTHPHSKLRTPQSVALYLQSFMSQGHKADHYSFETGSTTRPLNPWLLTYIPLIINIGHKTSCLYLFICFFFVFFYHPIVLWITGISTTPYTHQKQHSWTERVKRTPEKLRPQASSLIPAQIKPCFWEVYPTIVPASALCIEMTHKEILF